MTDIEKIQKFIFENQTLLDESRWTEFYALLRNYEFIGDVSYMLLKSGIDVFSQPNGLNNIPTKYMCNCNQLTEFILPNHYISRINDNAFRNCKNLETVDLIGNSSLHSIGAAAFVNCLSLREINLPKSLKLISKSAFYGTVNIEKVTYEGTWAEFQIIGYPLIINLKAGAKIVCSNCNFTIQEIRE